MAIKKLIIKTAVKVLIFAIFSTIVLNMLNGPIITNELALLQMEHSNGLYLMMDTYNRVRPFISFIYCFITVLFAANNIYDI